MKTLILIGILAIWGVVLARQPQSGGGSWVSTERRDLQPREMEEEQWRNQEEDWLEQENMEDYNINDAEFGADSWPREENQGERGDGLVDDLNQETLDESLDQETWDGDLDKGWEQGNDAASVTQGNKGRWLGVRGSWDRAYVSGETARDFGPKEESEDRPVADAIEEVVRDDPAASNREEGLGELDEEKQILPAAWWNVFPGTKWCGAGNKAKDTRELGKYKETDMCCREHANCPNSISPGETKWGLQNKLRYFKISDCRCDKRFLQCLSRVQEFPSQVVRHIYFSFMPCFTLKDGTATKYRLYH